MLIEHKNIFFGEPYLSNKCKDRVTFHETDWFCGWKEIKPPA